MKSIKESIRKHITIMEDAHKTELSLYKAINKYFKEFGHERGMNVLEKILMDISKKHGPSQVTDKSVGPKSVGGATIHEMMNEELVRLKLLSLKEVKNQKPNHPACRKYFMHGLGHSLGLDVHDVSNGQKKLVDGAVFTVEPGIYIPDEEIGIRLEDNIVISGNQPINLMKDTPLEPNEIEERMNP